MWSVRTCKNKHACDLFHISFFKLLTNIYHWVNKYIALARSIYYYTNQYIILVLCVKCPKKRASYVEGVFMSWHHHVSCWLHYHYLQHWINGLVQDCSNSIANAMELLQSCTKPSGCCESWWSTVHLERRCNLYATNWHCRLATSYSQLDEVSVKKNGHCMDVSLSTRELLTNSIYIINSVLTPGQMQFACY